MACAWVLLTAGAARAQVGLELPPTVDEETRGVRFGEFVFRPALSVEGRYNTNLFREAPEEGPSRAAILGIVPQFQIENPTPSVVRLRWDANARFQQYFSSDPNAKKQGVFGASNTLRADVLPRSVVGFFVMERFLREQLPPNLSSPARYDHNFNHAEAGVQLRPGGGALQFALSYAFNFDLFDQKKDLDSWSHEARLLGTWDLMPKTTILLDADFQVRTWRRPTAGLRVNSMPLRVQAGLRGFVTRKLAVIVMAGLGKGFYKSGTEFTNFIGQAGVGFQPLHSLFLEVGYRREFEDSYYANWYLGDTAYLNFGVQLLRRANLELSAEYTHVSYASFDPTTLGAGYSANQNSRKDHALLAKANVSWSLLRYLSIEVGYRMDALLTDFQFTGPGGTDRGRYVSHQVFGGLTGRY